MATKAQIDEAMQDAADAKNRGKEEDAYEAALTSTEMAPKPKKDARDAVRGQKGYANGGTASSRADGIASRGKTRGKMC
jgi:hypothetical protein